MASLIHSLKAGATRIPGVAPTARLLRRLIVPHDRNLHRLKRNQASGLFQHSAKTAPDRYPSLFQFVADDLKDSVRPHLLSFGCSSGEEVFSLAQYIPHAAITGIDINPSNIAKARKQLAREPNPNLSFKCAGSTTDEAAETFDAIFCMAVTRHPVLASDRPECSADHLPFHKFDDLMRDFDRVLKPGGLLVVWNSHFRFADGEVANRFEVVCHHALPPQDLLYGPDNRRIDGADEYTEAIFRKKS